MDLNPSFWLPMLLGGAVILPLLSFFVIFVAGARWMGKSGEHAAPLAVAAIGISAVLSFAALGIWLSNHWPTPISHGHDSAHAAADHSATGSATTHSATTHSATTESKETHEPKPAAVPHAADSTQPAAADATHPAAGEHPTESSHSEPAVYAGEYSFPGLGSWVLGQFRALRISISYYIDALTVSMFCMVSLIATLIHIYAMGYMHDELHDVTDHEVTMSDGEHLHRPGRYHRFFQYLSLFCFSMLGLVIAGNLAMVFVFWELVGICSYFLIGFYVERKSASTAANKAFIVNRVGDFGMLIGMMALWTGLGTFSFGDIPDANGQVQPGMFSMVRSTANQRRLAPPAGLAALEAKDEVAKVVLALGPNATKQQIDAAVANKLAELKAAADPKKASLGYWLLLIGGVGVFAGCVGKSAQFPLHVWLPDAMEGPTPVSALVHSATMVAAGVYLVGRFYPVFTPEALLVIAITGCITLFLAATIALTATDIKRVLAYSTVSQLGYMMLSLGVGGWLAGLMHLITHAFFKSLLFMCSGSVIHAVHTNDMREMGGLRRKMPVTAYTMLTGCLAIAGAGIPFMMGWLGGPPLSGLGFSGFYSKDAILEQAYSFWQRNPSAWSGVFFLAATGGAAITAFYMFRMWYLTFAGEPRNQHRYDHAHESPPVMYVPLIVLAIMAVAVAWTPLQALIGGLVGVIAFSLAKIFRKSSGADEHHEPGHATAHAPTHSSAAAHGGHGPDHGDSHHGDAHHGDAHHGAATGGLGRIPLGSVPLLASVLVTVIAGLQLVAYQVAGARAFTDLSLSNLLESARFPGTDLTSTAVLLPGWIWPAEHESHDPSIVLRVTVMAIGTAFSGFLLATFMYGLGFLNASDVQKQFQPIYRLLINKWWFDELYDWLFVKPTLGVSRMIAGFDRNWIDRFVDGLAAITKSFAFAWEYVADQAIVDGFVNRLAAWTYAVGLSLRVVQTGKIRQYVMFIVIGAVAIFVLISLWNSSLAG